MKKSSEFLSEYYVEQNCKSSIYTIESYLMNLITISFDNGFGTIMNNFYTNSSFQLKRTAHICQFIYLSILFSNVCKHRTFFNSWFNLCNSSDDYCNIIYYNKKINK